AENGGIKGNVRDVNTGVEIENVTVYIIGGSENTNTNSDGYYIISGLEPGSYKVVANIGGYIGDTLSVVVKSGNYELLNFYLKPEVKVYAGAKVRSKSKRKEDVDVGKTKIKPAELFKIPTIGGADLVQYLQILPGVVFSGDQGGQLYIRGGSPVMNKVLLDGMTIYNPFHSIGLFSVFDVDLMRSAEVYSAGFGAEYGGRVSAIVDVKTKDGDFRRTKGDFAISPFLGKLSLEGPLQKFRPKHGASSFVFLIKNSYLDRSSRVFYEVADPSKLPYSFNDIYGKLTFNSSNGSNFKMFGFNFKDKVSFPGSTTYSWNQTGLGTTFRMIPEGRQSTIDGYVTYSDYLINQDEVDQKPRSSSISGLNIGINIGSVNNEDIIKYGFDINAFSTDFSIFNSNNRSISQQEFTT